MPAIILRDLRARRPHHIGHRTVALGEVLARLQFRSEDDAKFFFNHLRWNAFEGVPVVAADTPAIIALREQATAAEAVLASVTEQHQSLIATADTAARAASAAVDDLIQQNAGAEAVDGQKAKAKAAQQALSDAKAAGKAARGVAEQGVADAKVDLAKAIQAADPTQDESAALKALRAEVAAAEAEVKKIKEQAKAKMAEADAKAKKARDELHALRQRSGTPLSELAETEHEDWIPKLESAGITTLEAIRASRHQALAELRAEEKGDAADTDKGATQRAASSADAKAKSLRSTVEHLLAKRA